MRGSLSLSLSLPLSPSPSPSPSLFFSRAPTPPHLLLPLSALALAPVLLVVVPAAVLLLVEVLVVEEGLALGRRGDARLLLLAGVCGVGVGAGLDGQREVSALGVVAQVEHGLVLQRPALGPAAIDVHAAPDAHGVVVVAPRREAAARAGDRGRA